MQCWIQKFLILNPLFRNTQQIQKFYRDNLSGILKVKVAPLERIEWFEN